MSPHDGRRQFVAAAVVAAVLLVYCAVRYGDAVGMFFFLDDFWVMRDADAAYRSPALSLLEFFKPSHNGLMLYRPLSTVGYFSLLRQLFGLDASAYHAFHVLLFACNGFLVAAIVRALTLSWGWGLAAGLLYAAAPGHMLAVYWIGAATMTVTAAVVLLSLLWWLHAPARWRGAGAAALQVVALLCSEHAAVVPALLAWLMVFGPRPATLRETVRAVLAPAAVTGIYLAAKLAYFLVAGFPHGGYAPAADPSAWVENIGRFAIATGSGPTLLLTSPQAPFAVGVTLLAALVALGVRARRRGGGSRLPALGLALFVTALLPVLPLTQHYFSYFIGVAALGMAIAVVGACRAVPRGGGAIAAVLVAAALATDPATCERAGRGEPGVKLLLGVQASSRDLVRSLDQTARLLPEGRFVHVPDSPLNMSVIGFGGAQRVFFDPPILVHYGTGPPPAWDPNPVSLLPPQANIPVPGRSAAWDWLRRAGTTLHQPWAAGCR